MNAEKPNKSHESKDKITNLLAQTIPIDYDMWVDTLKNVYGEINTSAQQEDKELWKSFLQKGIDTVAHLIQNAPVFSTVKEYSQWFKSNLLQEWMAVLDRIIEPTAGTDIETIKELLTKIVEKVIKPLKEKEKDFAFTPPAQSPADRALSRVKSTMYTFVHENLDELEK